MKDEDFEIDAAVAAYTAELQAEAELGRAEVGELEDHLRATIGELRAHGLTASHAIAEAARRLGDPRAVARESARVRSPFGARLSRARAWSIVALMVPLLASGFANISLMSARNRIELVLGAVLAVAIAARRTWARPILLAAMVFQTTWYIVALAGVGGVDAAWLVVQVGLVAFLVPWRRGELTAAGAALSLQVWAFCAATFALGFQYTSREGTWMLIAPAAQVALVAAFIATGGGVLRARWSALAAALSAGTLALALVEILQLRFRAGGAMFEVGSYAMIASGAVAAAASAVMSWRTAGSRLGSFRALNS